MKPSTLKNLTFAAAAVALFPLASCDSDDSKDKTPSEPRIQFPSALQDGDVISYDEVSSWNFTSTDSFTWDTGGDTNTIGRFRTNTSTETFTISDAGITKEEAELKLQERLDILLADFESILRTVPLMRVQAGEELTADDLRSFAELINAESTTRGEDIVTYDEDEEVIILNTNYDTDFQVTSGIGSFLDGIYTGTYSAIGEGNLIQFKQPSSDQRESYRLTNDHRLPAVTNSRRSIADPIEGNFSWTLSSIPPVVETPETTAPETTTP